MKYEKNLVLLLEDSAVAKNYLRCAQTFLDIPRDSAAKVKETLLSLMTSLPSNKYWRFCLEPSLNPVGGINCAGPDSPVARLLEASKLT